MEGAEGAVGSMREWLLTHLLPLEDTEPGESSQWRFLNGQSLHVVCSHFTGQCGNAMVKARQSSLSVCVCVCVCVCGGEGGCSLYGHFTGQCGNAVVKARQSSLSVCVCGRGVVHCMVTSLVSVGMRWSKPGAVKSVSVCVCGGGGCSLQGQSLHWSVWECAGQSQPVKSVGVCVREGGGGGGDFVHCMGIHFTGPVWECGGENRAVKSVEVGGLVVHSMVGHFTGQCGNAMAKARK